MTIRDELSPHPIAFMSPVPGVLPSEENVRQVTTRLLEDCRRERDAGEPQAA